MREKLQLVGSRDSISWITVVFFYTLVPSFSLLSASTWLRDGYGYLLTAAFIAVTVALAWLGFARWAIFHADPDAVRPAAVLFAFLITLVVRAGVMDYMLMFFGLQQQSRFWFRFMTSLPSTGVGLIIIAASVTLAREYSTMLERLRATRRSFAELPAQYETMIAKERVQVIELARISLAERLRGLDQTATSQALERVRAAIEEVVRPLSRSVAELRMTVAQPPDVVSRRIGWSSVREGFLTGNPIRPFWFSLALAFVGLLFAPWLWGVRTGIGYAAVIAVSSYIVCVVGWLLWDRFIAHQTWAARAVALTTVGIAGGTALSVTAATVLPQTAERGIEFGIVNVVIGIGIAWSFAAFVSLRRNCEHLSVQLIDAEQQLHRERVRLNAVMRAEMRALARTLHGPVQDALSAAAFRIRAALDGRDATSTLLAEVQQSVQDSLDRLPAAEREASDAVEVLQQLAELWDGVATIQWNLSPEAEAALDKFTTTRSSFNEIVRETCSNAVRHGQATVVSITATSSNDELDIRVRNTGEPIAENVTASFGTTLLTELAVSWSRVPTDHGTLVTARLPLVQ